MTYLISILNEDNYCVYEYNFIGTLFGACENAEKQLSSLGAAKAKIYRVYSSTNIVLQKEVQ